MKKIFIASQLLLAINLVILIVSTLGFQFIFHLFPSLASIEDGLGTYFWMFLICGTAGLFVTIPFSFLMILLYALYKYGMKKV